MLEKRDEEEKWTTKDQDHESKPKVRCDQPADGVGLVNRERGGASVRILTRGQQWTASVVEVALSKGEAQLWLLS